MKTNNSSPQNGLFPPPKHFLTVTQVGDQQVVHVGSLPIQVYGSGEVWVKRQTMVGLAEGGAFKAGTIASAFGVSRQYLSVLRTRYREEGAHALDGGHRGPKGPSKVTPRLSRQMRDLREQGFSLREIAGRVSRGKRKISYDTVRRVLAGGPEQAPLPEAGESLELEKESIESTPMEPEVASRYAGAMLLYVGLAVLGLWEAFQELQVSLGRAVRYDLNRVVAVVALGFALRLGSMERFKTALQRDLGALIGTPSVPTVRTLRRRIGELAESLDGVALNRIMFRNYIRAEPIGEGVYYLDGHFCPYTGEEPTAKGWDAKRRLARPGQTDIYVHDVTGRALFFMNCPANDHLSRKIPELLEEIRRVAGEQSILLIFDRGGFNSRLFSYLDEQGVGYITFLKGRLAKRRFPVEKFEKHWYAFEGRRWVYQIYEKGTRLRGVGRVRTLVVLHGEAQVPVLTNRLEMPAAKVVHLRGLRWRQENSFKYLSEHYGVEQLIQYGAEEKPDSTLVSNPARQRLRALVERTSQELIEAEARLGRVLDGNEEQVHPSSRGLKIAHAKMRRGIAEMKLKLVRLKNRLRHTPARLPKNELDPKAQRATLKTDRRNLVNAIKIATYNAERLLARQFNEGYQDSRDYLTIFRSLFHQPGTILRMPDGSLRVEIQAPSDPKVSHPLQVLIKNINKKNPQLFGQGPKLEFDLAPVN
jgi:transposase